MNANNRPAQPANNVTAQLNQLMTQYRVEIQQAQAKGQDTPEGQQHFNRAQQIKQVLQRYHQHQQQQNLNRAQASGQMNPGAPNRNPMAQQVAQPNPTPQMAAGAQRPASGAGVAQTPLEQQPQLTPQQLGQQQFRAQQGHQSAMSNMQVAGALQQRQAAIEELRRAQQDLEQRLQRADEALRTLAPESDQANRLRLSIQSMRSKLDQYKQRETQLLQEIRAAVTRQRQLAQQRQAAATGATAGLTGAVGPGAAGTPAQAQHGQPGQDQMPSLPNAMMARQGAVPQQVRLPGQPGHSGTPTMPAQPIPGNRPGVANMNQVPGPPGQAVPGPGPVPGGPTAPTAAPGVPANPAQNNPGPGLKRPTPGAVPANVPASMQSRPGVMMNLPISQNINVNPQIPVSVKQGAPTLINGGASGATGASALNSPALARIPPFEVSGDRVLSKRRLGELVSGILGEEGDSVFDGDVEEVLLDLADEFVTSVTTFACRLAKHRKSDTLEAKDIQMYLERNWNMRIPGYSSDEVRSIRKVAPTAAYQQKLSGIGMAKSVKK